MNRKTGPVSPSALRRRARVDVQKRLRQIRTDMDMAGIGADDRVLSEGTVPPSPAAHAMAEVQVFTEEDMELASKDIAVVPADWHDDGMVPWRSFKSTERVKRADASKEEQPPNYPRYDVKGIRTCDNYKDASRSQYQSGCNNSELQSTAEQEGELPERRIRKPVHCFGDSNELEEEPVNGVSGKASSQLHWQTPPSHRVPGSRVTSPQPGENCPGTAVPPQLPPSSAPGVNVRRPEEASSSLAYRPTWRGGGVTDTIPCSAAEAHILSLLETIKQQQDELVVKVNYLSSRLSGTPGPDVEMPDNIQFPLEQLEAVEAFEMFLKEPSNGPARQRVVSFLATIGGQDVKRVTWNILGRIFTDGVSHQINWKGVNNKKPFSRMETKALLFSAVRKNTVTRSATDAEVTKHAMRWFNLAADRATRRRVQPPATQTE
ncbi:uncharacterized protein LOC121685750 isoform X1 [Alosa sapidissima]|uniref:uncharacterized protein LOC121685750 isoform X1 n=1 Tax=Alosa sapidissima TaxID=34773 RepID=UPI001C0846FD|nr:uncharacterized protein LOC121685750 isoform X1 [Alosa sapidissima]XP_041922422.1 uncharacterized protein LOC121685750 isoform X1 [Alosa sapidissima]XP_041922423.1 uncharacterized protein LOC121685750 isoform X1 [Alosa sapidissima]